MKNRSRGVLPVILCFSAFLAVLTVLHLEYFFLFPAVFLPVAATAEFVENESWTFPLDSMLLLLYFSAAALGSAAVFYLLFKVKQHRSVSCQR